MNFAIFAMRFSDMKKREKATKPSVNEKAFRLVVPIVLIAIVSIAMKIACGRRIIGSMKKSSNYGFLQKLRLAGLM